MTILCHILHNLFHLISIKAIRDYYHHTTEETETQTSKFFKAIYMAEPRFKSRPVQNQRLCLFPNTKMSLRTKCKQQSK